MLPSQKGNTGVTEKKSIHDYLLGKMDIGKGVQRIAYLFESVHMVRLNKYKYTLEQFIPNKTFLSWNNERYLTPHDLKTDMKIADIQKHTPSELQTRLYLEYVINMISLYESEAQKYSRPPTGFSFSVDKPLYQALRDNISQILSQQNLTYSENTQGRFFLIPKDPVVSEAAEIVEKTDVKLAILEYNHITNRDNLTGKRKILQILANDFESKRLELENTKEWKDCASDLGFFFNNLNIRHNNIEGPKAIEAIQKMPEKELLEWYDTTYRLYLTAVLLHDYSNEDQQKKITALKEAVNPNLKQKKIRTNHQELKP